MTNGTLERILHIEDEPDIQTIARMTLETIGGFTVETCGSGQEAIETAPKFQPDLILLDVMMPGFDGLRTLGCLRAQVQLHEVPVVFMSARVQPEEIADYRARGADCVIPKPFDPALLPQQVSTLWSEFHSAQACQA